MVQKKGGSFGQSGASIIKAIINNKTFKVMKIFIENQFKKRSKQNRAKIKELSLCRKLENKYKVKPYSSRYYGAYIASLFSGYLFNLYSGLTGAGAVFIMIFLASYIQIGFLAALILGIILGATVGVLIEYFKRSVYTNEFSSLFSSQKEDREYLSAFLSILFFTAFSAGLSLFTSFNFPAVATTPPALIGVDTSQFKSYQEAIFIRKSEIAKIDKTRLWKGRLGGKDQKQKNLLFAEISNLESSFQKHREKQQKEAELENEKRQLAYESSISSGKLILFYITLFTESFFILSFWYKERYLWRCVEERIKLEDIQTEEAINLTPEQQTLSVEEEEQLEEELPHNVSAKRSIGFKIYGNEEPKNEPLTYTVPEPKKPNTLSVEEEENTVIEVITNVLQPNQKPCLNCGEIMTYKSVNKKFCSVSCRWSYWKKKKEEQLEEEQL